MGLEKAIEAAWQLFLRDPYDTPFSTIVAFTRARCPSVVEKRVRAEFEWRLRAWCGLPARPAEAPGRPAESLSTKSEARLLAGGRRRHDSAGRREVVAS